MAKRNRKRDDRSSKLPSGMWQRGRTHYARFKKNGRVIRKRLSTDYRVACQMLNKAVKWKRIADNPIASVQPLPHVELAKERRSLTLEEIEAIFDASPDHLLRTFYAICRKAGIEGAYRHGSVDIHSLRVSFTTLSIEHGANPQAQPRSADN